MQTTVLSSITLVTEAYNLAEGQSEDSFLGAVAAVDQIAQDNPDVRAVVMDPSKENICAPLLSRHYPHIHSIHVPGQSYDGQKNAICRAVDTDFVVFLDGDCRPRRKDWLAQILSPLADPSIPAVSGLTLYDDDSITGKAMTVLDFGFLFNSPGMPLGCYVSNNIAFRRQAMLDIPIPDEGILRSYCYKHAQLYERAGTPIRFNPEALVLHELPDIEKERFRRGYDYVAALWADPTLEETSLLEPTDNFVKYILNQNLGLAFMRLQNAPPQLGINSGNINEIAREIQRLIVKDINGITTAIRQGESDGSNKVAKTTHLALKSAQTFQSRSAYSLQ